MHELHTPYGRHLPLFPTLYGRPDYPLTEDRIEREVERLVDRADAAFMAGRASQEEYDAWNIALNRWIRQMHTFAQISAMGLTMELEAI